MQREKGRGGKREEGGKYEQRTTAKEPDLKEEKEAKEGLESGRRGMLIGISVLHVGV